MLFRSGDAALLVDPEDMDAWAGAVSRLLTEPSFRADVVARGLARAGQFTWERTARLTSDVYRRLVTA